MDKLPLVDLKIEYNQIKAEIDRTIQNALDNTAFILGKEVQSFEYEFADFCNAKHAIGVSSGTEALHLVLRALDIGNGDEVITTPMTFFATAEAISQVGAMPVFIDVEADSHNLDPNLIVDAITNKTKAILPVHLHGRPADMGQINQVAEQYNLYVVEDAAQAHGATYCGTTIGNLGTAACFSFYPGKNLGAYGDAGAIVTNDAELASKLRLLRDHGREDKYLHQIVGFNARIDALQAAILRVKLCYLADWNAMRESIAVRYTQRLADLPIVLPTPSTDIVSVWHHYAICLSEREELCEELNKKGISSGKHYPLSLHLQPAYSHLGYVRGDFPVAEQIADETLSLPIYPLLSERQMDRVVDAVESFFK